MANEAILRVRNSLPVNAQCETSASYEKLLKFAENYVLAQTKLAAKDISGKIKIPTKSF